MNTSATQPTNIDKRLEEMAHDCGDRACPDQTVANLAAALLGAREALRKGITTERHTHGGKEVYPGSRNHLDGCPTCRYVLAALDAPLRAALADTELEELLR